MEIWEGRKFRISKNPPLAKRHLLLDLKANIFLSNFFKQGGVKKSENSKKKNRKSLRNVVFHHAETFDHIWVTFGEVASVKTAITILHEP